ncbi:uncharacterized protein LOC132695673 isoform X1 [Cylas formicarius]|uniref:uncharacterized protein LOC132695673 isoform X1 n=1 Tax=Cylas formicarius TaxID=197179 RepID=UPI00295884E7|nr:uncharacterized protein LOC132695673 isoform X1 [Cylas formicarius]
MIMNEGSYSYDVVNELFKPIEELGWLFVNVFWGKESVIVNNCYYCMTVEDVILLVGTFVAFVAFILWCCFPVIPRDGKPLFQVRSDAFYREFCTREDRYNEIRQKN